MKYIYIVSLLVASFNAVAQQDVSVDVTSNKLEVERLKGYAVFTGNVKALYKDLTLTSDKLEIEYDEKSKAKNKIEMIIAKGNVKLVQGDDTVVAKLATYYVKQDKIIFEYNVTLNRNGNILKGDHLTLDTITNKAKMKSTSNTRVQAVYFKDKAAKKEQANSVPVAGNIADDNNKEILNEQK